MTQSEKIFWLNVGRHVAEARRRTCLTQEDLAVGIGRSRGHISKIETGRTRVEMFTAALIADICDVSVGELFPVWTKLKKIKGDYPLTTSNP
jgi:transcriptional regulator with XRE-family HTH domain